MVELVIKHITIKGKPLYICDTCGLHATGDTVRIDQYVNGDADAVADIINNHYIRPYHIPVDWVAAGLKAYCAECWRSRDEKSN
jgi:hypothetical protein